jgi:mRNA-degrading endonuclease YafQ of YafQ-DinJ toxin-antitoxin module
VFKVEFESKKVEREVRVMIADGRLSRDDQVILDAWIRQIAHHGPESIQRNGQWADHALEDDWIGYRSSSFSNQGRIIYRVEGKTIKIVIARITTTHDYRKGKKP